MPKNIVLLSDGTGNSAARIFKTNVWRLYEALNLVDPRVQVACYDDGVGTSSFLPVAVLGSAFGLGLRRNVLKLYRFLCEHYEPGDHVFLIGFSRGAFTVRVLVGLLEQEGVLRMKSRPGDEDSGRVVRDAGELQRLSRWAYRRFRYRFNQTGELVRLIRRGRDIFLSMYDGILGRSPYDVAARDKLDEIAFVGVWDTVDAYGLAIDELTHGVDQWVWPLSMPSQEPPAIIRKACHALSLDDERHTFHPVLWDESREPQNAGNTDEERVTQVWFAGAHANVGGGYPNDALAYLSLDWMAREAKKQGIDISHDLLGPITAKLDPHGRIYDSRRGLGGSYRYSPRHIRWLTNGQVHEGRLFGSPLASPRVSIERPKIHASVLERIVAAPAGYAPFILPEHYAVVSRNGDILEGADNPFESRAQSCWRAQAQETAWDTVWYRRIVYFATIAAVLALVLRPFRDGADVIIEASERGGAARAIQAIGAMLPSAASPWVDYFAAVPRELLLGLAAIGLLMAIGRNLQNAACSRMRAIWRTIATGSVPEHPPSVSRLTKLRTHASYQFAFALLRRRVLPTIFGIAALLWIAATVNRLGFEAASASGLVCRQSERLVKLTAGAPAIDLGFDVSEFCWPSGRELEAGARYRLTTKVVSPGMVDRRFSVTSAQITPADFEPLQQLVFLTHLPFRRIWFAKWGLAIARVGNRGLDYHPLRRSPTELSPRTSGELLFFMNDAIAPVAFRSAVPFIAVGWSEHYRDNPGRVVVSIEKLDDPPSPRPAAAAATF